MKKSHLLGAVCALTLTGLSFTTRAALVVPAELNPGDTYHVIFVSSTGRDATSASIQDYDDHVQGAADAAGIGATIGIDWLALGSTPTVSAYDHILQAFTETYANLRGRIYVCS